MSKNAASDFPAVAITNGLIDAEIVWARRFFRTSVWRNDLVGRAPGEGGDFVKWSYTGDSDPIGDIEAAKSLLPADAAAVLILGLGVVEVFRVHPAFQTRAQLVGRPVSPPLVEEILGLKKLVTAGSYFTDWVGSQQLAIQPRSALLIASSVRPDKQDIPRAEEYPSNYAMERPGQGVFFPHCV